MGSVFVLERNSPLDCNWRQKETEKEGEVGGGGGEGGDRGERREEKREGRKRQEKLLGWGCVG